MDYRVNVLKEENGLDVAIPKSTTPVHAGVGAASSREKRAAQDGGNKRNTPRQRKATGAFGSVCQVPAETGIRRYWSG
ncbi:hypothetical protein DSCA_31160 [Desulfosarcina alkanivorans]|uniref:Uncharacterized protein n=1 Tax=Desulfosarcina alkanivorans TaxID=571177 RepID=A0A5K7YJ40_9BACT|nr:hypothetical protein DSCA_31160 [Desulfosarcina alkanivorans]